MCTLRPRSTRCALKGLAPCHKPRCHNNFIHVRPRVLFPRRVAGPVWVGGNMPNKSKRDKHGKRRMRRRERSGDSVKVLLAGTAPALQRLSEQAARQALWRAWLDVHLPEEARAH